MFAVTIAAAIVLFVVVIVVNCLCFVLLLAAHVMMCLLFVLLSVFKFEYVLFWLFQWWLWPCGRRVQANAVVSMVVCLRVVIVLAAGWRYCCCSVFFCRADGHACSMILVKSVVVSV